MPGTAEIILPEDYRNDEATQPVMPAGPASLQATDIIKRPDLPDKNAELLDAIVDANRTECAVIRVLEQISYSPPDANSPFGYYNKRRIIGRNCRINGGVYLGGGAREAIYVDDLSDQGVLKNVYFELIQTLFKKMGKRLSLGLKIQDGIPEDVFDTVRRHMPYDEQKVLDIISGRRSDNEISLSEFIQKHAGQCRHQALLVGYLLERLIENGLLSGSVSAERNYLAGQGAHAWAAYQDKDGKIFIIDPAMGYQGPLEKAHGWLYHIPERASLEESIVANFEEDREMEPKWERKAAPPAKVAVLSALSSDSEACTEIKGSMDFKITGKKLEVYVCGIKNRANTVEIWKDAGKGVMVRYFSKGEIVTVSAKDLADSGGAIHIVKNDDRREVIISNNSPFNHCSLIIKGDTVTVANYDPSNKTAARLTEAEPDAHVPQIGEWREVEDTETMKLEEGAVLVLGLNREACGKGHVRIRKTGDSHIVSFRNEKSARVCRADELMRIKGTIFIGREERNDIVIDYPFVSASHCKVRFDGDMLEIMDNNSMNGTFFRVEKHR
jgi:hypothetical protein